MKSFEYKLTALRETAHSCCAEGGPAAIYQYYVENIRDHEQFRPEQEQLYVILLSTRMHIKGHLLISLGVIDGTLTHPREIFRPAIVGGAHSIALLHNHPSGDPTPSTSDTKITGEIASAGKLLKIKLVDHLICGDVDPSQDKPYTSLRELGYLY